MGTAKDSPHGGIGKEIAQAAQRKSCLCRGSSVRILPLHTEVGCHANSAVVQSAIRQVAVCHSQFSEPITTSRSITVAAVKTNLCSWWLVLVTGLSLLFNVRGAGSSTCTNVCLGEQPKTTLLRTRYAEQIWTCFGAGQLVQSGAR